jgi:hypothetical protein
LHTQQAYLVPARHVFASLQNHHTERKTDHERGIASGMTWEEALCQALFDWCNYLTIAALNDTSHIYTQVDLTSTTMTAEGTYAHHLLKTVGEQITIYDVTGSLQIPTFATCLGEKVIAYSTHCDVAQALRMGLMQALQQYQSSQSQQLEYAVAPVPDLPLSLRSNQLQIPHYTQPVTWAARLEWLLHTFQANKFRTFAIPLDHDPTLMRALPFIVRVLLGHELGINEA